MSWNLQESLAGSRTRERGRREIEERYQEERERKERTEGSDCSFTAPFLQTFYRLLKRERRRRRRREAK